MTVAGFVTTPLLLLDVLLLSGCSIGDLLWIIAADVLMIITGPPPPPPPPPCALINHPSCNNHATYLQSATCNRPCRPCTILLRVTDVTGLHLRLDVHAVQASSVLWSPTANG